MTPNESPSPEPRTPGAAAAFRSPVRTLLAALAAASCTAVVGTAADLPAVAVALCLPAVAAAAWTAGVRGGVIASLGGALGWYLPVIVAAHAVAWSSAVAGVVVCFGCAVLVDRLHVARRQAAEAAESDELTGLLNKRGFFARLEAERNRSLRTARPLGIAFLDCDDFKTVNATRGHLAGDKLLITIARTLRRNVRNYDSVARFGGDEFAVLFPEMDAEAARAASQRLVQSLHTAARDEGFPITVSLGLVVFNEPREPRQMLAAADAEMYAVKRNGKGGASVRGPTVEGRHAVS